MLSIPKRQHTPIKMSSGAVQQLSRLNHTAFRREMKEETVMAQVHRTLKSEEEKHHPNTPSREVSVDEESQINTKIITLIESEMKREQASHNKHFTDSRPQSLSFYEEEKLPEELSGDLELLSPEERRHYRKMNAYNGLQDTEALRKAAKARRKRHESELGDSREMMIPKEKKKSKRKKREGTSPSNGNNKRKHKRREDEAESKTEMTLALEELQDDVFDSMDVVSKPEKVRRSPRKSDKVYVQKKNKFEAVSRSHLNRQGAHDLEDDPSARK